MSSAMARAASVASRLFQSGQELKFICPTIITMARKCRTFSSTSVQRQLDLSGIFPPITTPFNKDESLAFDKLEYNMEKWNKLPFKGYVVQGSTGEFYYLDPEERVQVVKEVIRLARPGKLVIAGSGCESTRDTIKMSRRMADAGANAVMVVTPCYYKGRMSQDALIAHYTKVADQSPVPVILYSIPSNTGLDIPPEAVTTLAQHPNIIGLKDSGGDITRIASLVFSTASENFQILSGSAGFLLAAYNVGCVGGVCGLANVLGEEVCRLSDLANSRDIKAAKELQLRIVSPNAAVTRRFGIPGTKAIMDLLGYYGGPLRSPLLPLSSSEVAALKEVFSKSGFL